MSDRQHVVVGYFVRRTIKEPNSGMTLFAETRTLYPTRSLGRGGKSVNLNLTKLGAAGQ